MCSLTHLCDWGYHCWWAGIDTRWDAWWDPAVRKLSPHCLLQNFSSWLLETVLSYLECVESLKHELKKTWIHSNFESPLKYFGLIWTNMNRNKTKIYIWLKVKKIKLAFALFFNANMYKSYLQSSVNFFFFWVIVKSSLCLNCTLSMHDVKLAQQWSTNGIKCLCTTIQSTIGITHLSR